MLRSCASRLSASTRFVRAVSIRRSLFAATSIARPVTTVAGAATANIKSAVPVRSFHRSAAGASTTATATTGATGSLPAHLLSHKYEHLTITPASAAPNHALVVTLNRPDLHNAFNEVVISELTHAFKEISKAAAVKYKPP